MKLNTIDEAISILNAIKEGKGIQYYSQSGGGWYDRTSKALPDFEWCTYRIKPEPKYDWATEWAIGDGAWKDRGIHYSVSEKEMTAVIDKLTAKHGKTHRFRARKIEGSEHE